MDAEEFVRLKDPSILLIAEWRLSRPMEIESWTNYGGGAPNVWYVDFTDGEVVAVEVDGFEYDEMGSVPECNATALTWYYDDLNQRLYIHMIAGADPETQVSGGDYLYCIEAYFYVGFTNRKDQDVNFARQDEIVLDGNFNGYRSPVFIFWDWSQQEIAASVCTHSTDTYDDDSGWCARLEIDGAGSLARYYQLVHSKANRLQTFSLYYKMDGAGQTASVRIYDSGSNVWLNAAGAWIAGATDIALANSVTWVQLTITFTAHASYSNYYVELRSVNANARVNLDYVSWIRYRQPMNYLPYLHSTSVPNIRQAVGDYHAPEERVDFGPMSFLQDGWFYSKRTVYHWDNKLLYIKVGELGSSWAELAVVIKGNSLTPDWGDEDFSVQITDQRLRKFRKVPSYLEDSGGFFTHRFTPTSYPNVDPNYLNAIVPVLVGEKTNITPPCEDTVNHRYRVSRTNFHCDDPITGRLTVDASIQSVDNVYLDDQIIPAAAWVADAGNGRFTLNRNPGNAIVTCDAKGQAWIDMSTSAYSENVADFMRFAMIYLNNIHPRDINIASLLRLKAARTDKLCELVKEEQDFGELLKKWKTSATFQSFPRLDGQYVVEFYQTGEPSGTPYFFVHDFKSIRIRNMTDQCYKSVVVKYDQDPTGGEWLEVSAPVNRAAWSHGSAKELILYTSLRVQAEAEALRDFYVGYVEKPPERLNAVLDIRPLIMNPTDKAVFYKIVTDAEENVITVLDYQVFRLLELDKNVSDGIVKVVGKEDIA